MQDTWGNNHLEKLNDIDSFPDWSKEAIIFAVRTGCMGGYPDNTFRPTKKITMAETISVLDRMAEIICVAQKDKINRRKDNAAPVFALGYPKVNNVSQTQLTLAVKSNEAGKAYYVVLPDGVEKPTAKQIKAGQDALGNIIDENRKGTLNLFANREASFTITGLTSLTPYDIYVVAEDNVANVQATATKVEVTTAASNDATLSDLKVDGETVAGFSPERQSYEVIVRYDIENVPLVTATAHHAGARVTVTPAGGFTLPNNTTTVLVTAENGRTQAYTVSFVKGINTYTLTYTAGANGSISGETPQTVNYGSSGTAVTAVPTEGYHFVKWSDESVQNPRTDSNVTENISVTANFAINEYNVS